MFFFLHCRKCYWYHKLCSCWQVLTQVYLQNIWLLKYSHIKDAPFAQKTGGIWWGGQAEPKADGGWDALGGQRAVRLDPLGWKSGTAKGQSRLVTGHVGGGRESQSLLRSGFSLLCLPTWAIGPLAGTVPYVLPRDTLSASRGLSPSLGEAE